MTATGKPWCPRGARPSFAPQAVPPLAGHLFAATSPDSDAVSFRVVNRSVRQVEVAPGSAAHRRRDAARPREPGAAPIRFIALKFKLIQLLNLLECINRRTRVSIIVLDQRV